MVMKKIKERLNEYKEYRKTKKLIKERQRKIDREQKLKDYEELLKYASQKKSESFLEKEKKRIDSRYKEFKKNENK